MQVTTRPHSFLDNTVVVEVGGVPVVNVGPEGIRIRGFSHPERSLIKNLMEVIACQAKAKDIPDHLRRHPSEEKEIKALRDRVAYLESFLSEKVKKGAQV